MNLGTAMLGLGDVLGGRAEAPIAELRGGDSNAIDVARRDAGRACKPDEQRVEVRAFAAKGARLEHRGDVARPAAASRSVAERILDHPLVDRARLLEIGVC